MKAVLTKLTFYFLYGLGSQSLGRYWPSGNAFSITIHIEKFPHKHVQRFVLWVVITLWSWQQILEFPFINEVMKHLLLEKYISPENSVCDSLYRIGVSQPPVSYVSFCYSNAFWEILSFDTFSHHIIHFSSNNIIVHFSWLVELITGNITYEPCCLILWFNHIQ